MKIDKFYIIGFLFGAIGPFAIYLSQDGGLNLFSEKLLLYFFPSFFTLLLTEVLPPLLSSTLFLMEAFLNMVMFSIVFGLTSKAIRHFLYLKKISFSFFYTTIVSILVTLLSFVGMSYSFGFVLQEFLKSDYINAIIAMMVLCFCFIINYCNLKWSDKKLHF